MAQTVYDRIVNVARRVARAKGWGGPSLRADIWSMLEPTPDLAAGDHRRGAFESLVYGHEGPVVHKWHHYLPLYDRYIGGFRDRVAPRPLRMLEIGVFKGGSLAIWRKFLGPDAVLFGIDIDPACAALDGRDGHVRIGSQADPAFLRRVIDEMGGVDVVLDDGSHVASHQRISFETLFPHLADPGLYIIEDTHTAYWPGWFEGGLRRPGSIVETAKALVDDVHRAFHGRAPRSPVADGLVGGIHFHNSMIVIEKGRQPPLGHSFVGEGAQALYAQRAGHPMDGTGADRG